jgi:acyl-CoA thioester hydrolase
MTAASPNEWRVTPRFQEVDMMSVVHHASHIVWLEESRFHFMESVLGVSMAEMLAQGYYLPVVELEARYLRSVRAREGMAVTTLCTVHESGALSFRYQMTGVGQRGVYFKGRTKHVFTDEGFRLQYRIPEFYRRRFEAAQQAFPDCVQLESGGTHGPA